MSAASYEDSPHEGEDTSFSKGGNLFSNSESLCDNKEKDQRESLSQRKELEGSIYRKSAVADGEERDLFRDNGEDISGKNLKLICWKYNSA